MSIRSHLDSIFRLNSPSAISQASSFMEAHGKVIAPIKPNCIGRVKLQGVSWLARCPDTLLHPLPINTPIQVIDRLGLTLIVRPINQSIGVQAAVCGHSRLRVTPPLPQPQSHNSRLNNRG